MRPILPWKSGPLRAASRAPSQKRPLRPVHVSGFGDDFDVLYLWLTRGGSAVPTGLGSIFSGLLRGAEAPLFHLHLPAFWRGLKSRSSPARRGSVGLIDRSMRTGVPILRRRARHHLCRVATAMRFSARRDISAVPTGLVSPHPIYPALKRWAKLFRPYGTWFHFSLASDAALKRRSSTALCAPRDAASRPPAHSRQYIRYERCRR
jgi:hypothetical protein